MLSKWRRFEVLFPLEFNDGKSGLDQLELWVISYTIDVE